MAGVWNFGQLAIYALGAYSAGWLMLHQTWLPPWLAILAGGIFAAFVSVLLAFPTLRLFGIYTSLLTFAFAEVVQYVALNDPRGLTGGSYGFPTVPGLLLDVRSDALPALLLLGVRGGDRGVVPGSGVAAPVAPGNRAAVDPRRAGLRGRARRQPAHGARGRIRPVRASWRASRGRSTSASSSRSRRARWASRRCRSTSRCS